MHRSATNSTSLCLCGPFLEPGMQRALLLQPVSFFAAGAIAPILDKLFGGALFCVPEKELPLPGSY
jgi:hypothetical protein